MAIAFVSPGVTAGGLNTFTTGGVSDSGANFVAVAQNGYYAGGIGTLSESLSNLFSTLTPAGAAHCNGVLNYFTNPTTGGSVTWTDAGSTIASVLGVLPFSGVDTSSPFDQEAVSGVQTNRTFVLPGSITPTVDGCVVITSLTWDSDAGSVVAVSDGFTIAFQTANVPGNNLGGAIAYLIQTSRSSVDPLWSWTNSVGNVCSNIASFKPAAGGGGGSPLKLNPLLNGLGSAGGFFRNPLGFPIH